jgi:F420H(2)-dependent quinone reductase
MKHRIVHALQEYLLNPPIKLLFTIGVAPPGYALLETTGRMTGKARRTPVGDGWVGCQFWLVAEHGMKAGYVRNCCEPTRTAEIASWDSGPLAYGHGARCYPTMMRGSARGGLLVGGLAPP